MVNYFFISTKSWSTESLLKGNKPVYNFITVRLKFIKVILMIFNKHFWHA